MSESYIIDRLKGLQFFRGLSQEQLEIVGEHVVGHVFEPGEVIFEEGDPGDSVYFIIDGELDVTMQSDWEEEVKLATLGPGQSCGEISIIDDLPRSASVIAVTQSSVLSLNKKGFEQVLEEHPVIGVVLLKGLACFLCEHVRQSNESLSDFLEPT